MPFLALILAGLWLVSPGPSAAAVVETQRAQFKQAFDALTAGRSTYADQLVKGLEGYPLFVYFEHHRLRNGLHQAPAAEIEAFLRAYDGSVLAARLRRDWLELLARRKDWPLFLHVYRPQGDTRLECLFLTARIKQGAMAGVLDAARALWLVGVSQPDECGPVFTALEASGLMDDALIWQRIRLAMAGGKTSLARYLARRLSVAKDRTLVDKWVVVHGDPAGGLRDPALREDTARVREIVAHALTRIAAGDVDAALVQWSKTSSNYGFTAAERARILYGLALAAARNAHPQRIALLDQVDPALVDEKIENYRLREAIREQDWAMLARWTEQPPVAASNALRSRYWRARALHATGRGDEAGALFAALAKERDYYGFAAADQLGVPYEMNDVPVAASEAELSGVAQRPGILRARELFMLDMPFLARREWHHEIEQLSRRGQEIAARIAHDWGWHDRAIITLGKAQSYDDLELRFPVLHLEEVGRYAHKRGLDEAVLLSIIRSESAFMTDARSPAGALGLMQLLPATGRDTARRLGVKLGKTEELFDAGLSITLGSAYLKQMLDRFDGNLPMAAAAYNAGPNRVAAWRPTGACIRGDIWIETIPFAETQGYVKRALFYTVVYEARLERQLTPVKTRLVAIPDRTRRSHTQC